MKLHRLVVFVGLITLLSIFVVNCDSSDKTPSADDTLLQTIPDFIGDITEVHRNGTNGTIGTILVEAEVIKGSDTYVDKFVITIKDETDIFKHDVKVIVRMPFDALEVGQQAQIWFSGPVKESFPMQVDAAQVIIAPPKNDDVVGLDEQFLLAIGQTVSVEEPDLTIGFQEVIEDSRCPSDATCIWEGKVSAVIKITDGDSPQELTLTQPGLTEEYSIAAFNGYTISFKVLPYPKTDMQVSESEYLLQLILSQAAIDDTGVLKGHVTIGPIEPVVRPGDDPSDIPPEVYDARKIMVYGESGNTLIKQVDIGHDGNYSVELPPGTYLVDINRLGIDFSSEVPREVHIKTGDINKLPRSKLTGY